MRRVRTWALLLLEACRSDPQPAKTGSRPPSSVPAQVETPADPFRDERDRMVDTSIVGRGVSDKRVIAAMRKVPRHRLVPEELVGRAYEDRPLAIGFEQTISQPYIVAAMTEAAQIAAGERVLEVGTGSGYQAAVLAEIGAEVYSIEIVEPLAKRTHELLAKLGYDKLHLRIGDGYRGWPEAAPFDAIIVTAAPSEIPPPLLEQLAVGGKLVIPVGDYGDQVLRVITRNDKGTTSEELFRVAFVPMTGAAQEPAKP